MGHPVRAEVAAGHGATQGGPRCVARRPRAKTGSTGLSVVLDCSAEVNLWQLGRLSHAWLKKSTSS
eukprot:13620633-Alexandrium_andersonii.AAC.1